MEIRLLADHREDLIAERTRAQNRLRWHLVDLAPELEAALPPGGLDRAVQLDARASAAAPAALGKGQGRARARRSYPSADAPSQDARARAPRPRHRERPELVAEQGCGTLTAATIIGRIAGAERFPTDAHFARHAGTAPIPASSGRRDRHRYHRGGDRKLNRALQTLPSRERAWIRRPRPSWHASAQKARATAKQFARSSAT